MSNSISSTPPPPTPPEPPVDTNPNPGGLWPENAPLPPGGLLKPNDPGPGGILGPDDPKPDLFDPNAPDLFPPVDGFDEFPSTDGNC
jgi:hypothetical protein